VMVAAAAGLPCLQLLTSSNKTVIVPVSMSRTRKDLR